MKKITKIILQVAIIHIFLFLAIGIKALWPVPLPTTIIGLILLLLALQFKLIKLEWIEEGGRWLMAELLLFFIPSAVGIVNYQEIASLQGLGLVLIIGLSTAVVMGVTALVVERLGGRT